MLCVPIKDKSDELIVNVVFWTLFNQTGIVAIPSTKKE
jgi:hypothetical protein